MHSLTQRIVFVGPDSSYTPVVKDWLMKKGVAVEDESVEHDRMSTVVTLTRAQFTRVRSLLRGDDWPEKPIMQSGVPYKSYFAILMPSGDAAVLPEYIRPEGYVSQSHVLRNSRSRTTPINLTADRIDLNITQRRKR